MPLLTIETNQPCAGADSLKALSKMTAQLLGKPESYVMVRFQTNKDMLFAGSDAPLALVTMKSLGLPEDRTASFSKEICSLLEELLEVPSERVYVEFSGPERHMWGWNKSTF